jgi:hypothetical protein
MSFLLHLPLDPPSIVESTLPLSIWPTAFTSVTIYTTLIEEFQLCTTQDGGCKFPGHQSKREILCRGVDPWTKYQSDREELWRARQQACSRMLSPVHLE